LAKPIKSQEKDSINRTANDDSDNTCSKNSNACDSTDKTVQSERSGDVLKDDSKATKGDDVARTMDEACIKVEKLNI
jgi:hypothetical protein